MATRDSSFARTQRSRVVSEFAPHRGRELSAPTVRRHPFYEPLPKAPEGPGIGRVSLRLLRKAVRFLFPGGGRRLSSRGPVVMCSMMIGLAALLMALRTGQSLSPVADKTAGTETETTLAQSDAEFPTQAVMDVPDAIESFDRFERTSVAPSAVRPHVARKTRAVARPQASHAVASIPDDLESTPVLNAFWSGSPHPAMEQSVAWPPPLARSAVAKESLPAGSGSSETPSRSDRSSEAQSVRTRALSHLGEARRSLLDGRLVDAWHSSRSAADLNASYEVFDDRPELVFAEIERLLMDYQVWQASRRSTPGSDPLGQSGPQMASAFDSSTTPRARHAHARAHLPAIKPGPVAARGPLDPVRHERASVSP